MLIIPVFIPHLGCPHDCVFCNQRSISGAQDLPTDEEIITQIENYKKISENYDEIQLAFFGGSFTAIPVEQQEHFLRLVFPYVKKSGNKSAFIDSLRLSTRPDAIDEEVLGRLKRFGVSTIELGAQSMDDKVLVLSGRGHKVSDTVKSSRMIKEKGFILGLQTMPGLPGSTEEQDIETAEKIIALGPAIVRIYPTIVIKNTALHKMMLLGKYTPMRLEDAVCLCAKLTRMYEDAGIKVIRTGLHSSENMCEDKDVAGGPYHPAFGDMVRSKILIDELIPKIDKVISEKRDISENFKADTLTIVVPSNMISTFTGNKKCNSNALESKYGVKKVRFVSSAPDKNSSGNISENTVSGNDLTVYF